MAAEGGSEQPGKGAGRPARGRPRSRGQGARGRAARLRIGAAPAVGPRCRKGWPCAFGLMVPRQPKRVQEEARGLGPLTLLTAQRVEKAPVISRGAALCLRGGHCGHAGCSCQCVPWATRPVHTWPGCPPCCARLSPARSPLSGPLQEGASDTLGPVWGPPVGMCGLAGPCPRGSGARWTLLAEPTAADTVVPAGSPAEPRGDQGPDRERAGLWAGGALGSIPSQLSHDAPVIRALLLGTPTPHSCRDQPAAPPPAGPGRSMCPGSGGLSHGGDGGRGARNLKRKQQRPENLENASQ